MIIGIITNNSLVGNNVSEMMRMIMTKEYDQHEVIQDIIFDTKCENSEWLIRTFQDCMSSIAFNDYYKALMSDETHIKVDNARHVEKMYEFYVPEYKWIIKDVTFNNEVTSIIYRGGAIIKVIDPNGFKVPATNYNTIYNHQFTGHQDLYNFLISALEKLKLI